MNEEDFASDSDSDDLDFCPEKINKSDSDSIDEKDEKYDLEEQQDGENSKKKKLKKKRGKTKENLRVVEEQAEATTIDSEKQKQREDDLWAAFMGDSEPPPLKPASTSTKKHIPKEQKLIPQVKAAPPPEQPKIFEFAGEEVVVENVSQNSSQSTSAQPSTVSGVKRSSAGGLSSVLNQITKKNKLSVLQKTKIDWDGFKSTEGLSEELKTHNRGKEGFLERRDFLERTDLRQFEIEKNMRHQSRRSHK